jgi:hypothetical protein
MLTYDEWVAQPRIQEVARKYQGSHSQRREFLKDLYVTERAGHGSRSKLLKRVADAEANGRTWLQDDRRRAAQMLGAREHLPRSVPRGAVAVAKDAALRLLERSEYLQAMLDPFRSQPARFPGLECMKTTTLKLHQEVPVYAIDGKACIMMRPGLEHVFAVSGQDSVSRGSESPINIPVGELSYQGFFGASPNKYPNPPEWTKELWSVPEFESFAQARDVRDLLTDYRVTAAAMRFTPTSALLERSGMSTAARLPGSYGAPSFANHGFSLATGEVDSINLSHVQGGINRANVATLDTAEDHEVLKDPIEVIWRPASIAVASDFRPTRYRPFSPSGIGYLASGGAANFVVDVDCPTPPSCSSNPAAYKAFLDQLYSLNPCVTGNPNSTVLPPWTSGKSSLWNVDFNGMDATQIVAALKASYAEILRGYTNTTMADGDELLILAMDGLPTPTPSHDEADNPIPIQVGVAEFVVHIEGLVDSRTLNLAGSLSDRRTEFHHPAKPSLLLSAAREYPTIKPKPAAHRTWIQKAGAWLSGAVQTVGGWIDRAAPYVEAGAALLGAL